MTHLRRRTQRSTATDISEILNNENDPESMMLSAKRSVSHDIDDINNKTQNGALMVSDDEDMELDLDKNTPYNIRSFDDGNHYDPNNLDINMNINSKYYNSNNNNYFEPFVNPMTGSPTSFNTTNETSTRNEKCMRRILQFTFILSLIFFISPLIFFIAGASQIIPQYATISVAVRENNDTDDKNVKDFWHFPTIHNICTQGQASNHYCIRYIFFLIYIILFTIMFICCVSLFAIRKGKHPLKLRNIYIYIYIMYVMCKDIYTQIKKLYICEYILYCFTILYDLGMYRIIICTKLVGM